MRHRLTPATSLLFAIALAVGTLLGTAIPAAACSCVAPQPMAAYAGDPDQVIFTGVVQLPDARGVPILVTNWFQGLDPAPTVWLAREGFGNDGASCGTALPPAGTEWIFVAYRTEGSELGVNLCTPHAAASAPEGQAMFADAVATFGQGQTINAEPSTPPSAPTNPEAPIAPDTQLPAATLAALAVGAFVLIGAIIVLARRRRLGRGDQG